MDILLANPRGFCAGVDRAIDIVNRALDLFGAPIYVRHEVVHNKFVVDRLRGRSELAPTPAHCAAVGDMLARMHLAGASFDLAQPNLRGLPWWNETAPVVMPLIVGFISRANLLTKCLANKIASPVRSARSGILTVTSPNR